MKKYNKPRDYSYISFKKDFCEICGTTDFYMVGDYRVKKNPTQRLSVHHKDMNRENNNPNNLLTVCTPCHRELERPFPKRSPSLYN